MSELLGKYKNKITPTKQKRVTWKEPLVDTKRHTPRFSQITSPTANTTNLKENINTKVNITPGIGTQYHNNVNTVNVVTNNNNNTNNQNRPTQWWPPNITSIIKDILATPQHHPQPTLFSFELSKEAATKNLCILDRFDRNLQKAIDAQPNTSISYGSEFRAPETLTPLLKHHPNWDRFQKLLTHGSIWPLTPITEESRQHDLQLAIEFGNHKGAKADPELLRQLITKDVIQGFILPLPLSKITNILGILISPMNIVHQDTIDNAGHVTPKSRLTHNQSFVFDGSHTSVNSRLDKSQLTPCIFGWAIRRLINWTVAARQKHPNCRIYATKTDFKSAYRRCHMNSSVALQSCSQLPDLDIALIVLRRTFGGAACRFEWSIISETICDLASAIAHDTSWDPSTLHSPDQHHIPPPDFLPDDIPFAEGRDLIIDININDKGTHEMYLDDLIGLGIDIPETNNKSISEAAPLLAIHTCARPIHNKEQTPRTPMVSRPKLDAEGKLSEIKTILGWVWNFRQLSISLPDNKHVTWSGSISKIISAKRVKTKDLEQTIGRLTHLSLIIPSVHHFMSRLRELHTQASRKNLRSTQVSEPCTEDLHLMLTFLHKANHGVSMNILSYRKPTHVYQSDSCPAGLGGFSHEGFAWGYFLPYSSRPATARRLCIVNDVEHNK